MTLTELQAEGMSESIQLVSWVTHAPDSRWPSNWSKPQFLIFRHMANSNSQVTESLRIWVYTTPGRQPSLSHYYLYYQAAKAIHRELYIVIILLFLSLLGTSTEIY